MAKFKMNDVVVVKATGQRGTVMCREDVCDKDTKHTVVSYLVKLGEGFENYRQFTRKELKRVPKAEEPRTDVVKEYDAPNGFKVTMVGLTNTVDGDFYWEDGIKPRFRKEKLFRLGVSIYNPADEYNAERGYKIARHRALNRPFCSMTARFLGEFNKPTVEAIMDAKASYIIKNINKFVNI